MRYLDTVCSQYMILVLRMQRRGWEMGTVHFLVATIVAIVGNIEHCCCGGTGSGA